MKNVYQEIADQLRKQLLESIDSYCNYAYKRGVWDCIQMIEAEGEKHEHRSSCRQLLKR